MAMGIGVCEVIREYASPLVFSAYWSILFPLCHFIGRNRLVHPAPGRWAALGWPYSTMLDLADGILPAVTFVWLGLLVYLLLLLRLRRVNELSSFRVLLGLSTSLSVLLAATIGLFYYLKHPVINVQYAANEGFYSVFHICASPSVYAPYRSKKTPPACKLRAQYRIRFHSVGATPSKH
jgi:hypothetical protein